MKPLSKNSLQEFFNSLGLKISRFVLKNQGFWRDSLFNFGFSGLFLFVLLIFTLFNKDLFSSSNNLINSVIPINNFPSQQGDKEELFIGGIEVSPESPDLSFVQKTTLFGFSPPVIITPQVLGQIIGDRKLEGRKEVIEYTVQPGETLLSIANKFEISPETILWANDLNNKSVIKPGQKLIILPVSGILHYVNKGDTLDGIAKKYKAEKSEIISFNELSDEGEIFIGDILIVPGGTRPLPAKKPVSSSFTQTPVANSYFFTPVKGKISQGPHWYNAVDIASDCGNPIFASAGGEIQKTGNSWPSGNYIRILHPNGVVTFYGHLSGISVKRGDVVSPGDIIGYVGRTGLATGCHLHFEVRGAKNPFSQYPVGTSI